jgi:hypothetical protein
LSSGNRETTNTSVPIAAAYPTRPCRFGFPSATVHVASSAPKKKNEESKSACGSSSEPTTSAAKTVSGAASGARRRSSSGSVANSAITVSVACDPGSGAAQISIVAATRIATASTSIA